MEIIMWRSDFDWQEVEHHNATENKCSINRDALFILLFIIKIPTTITFFYSYI